MRKPSAFGLGAITSLGICGATAALVVAGGLIDVSAVNASGPQDGLLAFAAKRSIQHHAKNESNPLANDVSALREGRVRYQTLCAPCHGGPGIDPAAFAAGLFPPAPDLASSEIQSYTDGMLFQTISGGIGSTGMPAFGPTHDASQIWGIVTALRHLQSLPRPEKAAPGATAPGAVSPQPTGADEHLHRVSITGFKFVPAALEAKEGDEVEWVNEDFVAHTATARDHTFDTGKLDANQSKRVTLTKKGTFPYFCRFHIAMKGTLTVR